jgi:cell division GTPase FtsZ
MKKTAIVVGIGNAGIKVVEKLDPQGCYGNTIYKTLGISTNDEDFKNTNIKDNVQIGVLTCQEPIYNDDDIDLGRDALLEQLGIIVEKIESPDYVLIIANFGSGTAAGAAIELAENLDKLYIPSVCFGIKPFEFEGKRKLSNFYDGMLESIVNNVAKYIFDSDELIKPYIHKKLTMQKACEIIYEIIQKRIKNVMSKQVL